MNYICLPEQLTCDPPSVLFRLGMNTDPKNQWAGRVSMNHITDCWQGRLTLTPLPVAVGKAVWKGK